MRYGILINYLEKINALRLMADISPYAVNVLTLLQISNNYLSGLKLLKFHNLDNISNLNSLKYSSLNVSETSPHLSGL